MEFETIYKAYWDKVFRLCMGYVNDCTLAQDMAQDIFIKVWQHLPDFRGEASPGTWIFRIATNYCLRQLEREGRFASVELPDHLTDDERTDIELRVSLLYKFISELPEVDRIIISLELEDVKQADIAQIVGLSESNIRVKVHRIKIQLANKFKAYEK